MGDMRIKVLLVEDNEPDVKQVIRLLQQAPEQNFDITSVKRLQFAIEEIEKARYNIVLLDLGLPDSKGITTFEEIKKVCPEIPIVIFTVLGNEEAGMEAIRKGAQDYLVKGTSDERILSKSIRYAIERKHLEVHQFHTQEKLRESEDRFRNIFTNAAIGMVEYDPNQKFQSVNDYACEVLGYTREELLGKRVLDITAPEDLALTKEKNNLIHSGESNKFAYEKRYIRKDGSRVWARVTLSAIRSKNGIHVLTVGTIEDISQRKSVEDAVNRSETLLKQAGKLANLGAWELPFEQIQNTNANPLYWSDQVFKIFGFTPHTIKVSNELFFERVHPDDRQKISEAVTKALDEKKPYMIEHRIIKPDLTEAIVAEYAEIIFDDQNRPLRMMGAIQDITERKKTERELRESEERFRIMADGVPMIIWVTNKEGGIQFVNRTYTEFFGTTLEQVQGGNWQPLVHPDDAESYTKEYLRSVREQKPFRAEGRVRRADGEWRWVMSYGEPRYSTNGEFLGHVGLSPDITERKQAEEALRESEKRFRGLVLASSDVLYKMSPDWSEMIQLNSAGFLVETLKPNPLWRQEYIYPDDLPHVNEAIKEAIHKKNVFELEHRVIRSDGTFGWTFSRAVPMLDENGEITEWFGAASDVTTRKMAEEQLRLNEARFRIAIKNAKFVPAQIDRNLRYVWIFNPHPDFDPSMVIGKRDDEIDTSEGARELVAFKTSVLESGVGSAKEITFERSDGAHTYDFIIEPDKDEKNRVTGLFSAAFDITDRKAAEEALKKSENRLKILNENLESLVAQRTEQVRSLSAALTFTEQRERKRFSYILHEGLQQKLLGARILLNQHTEDHQLNKDYNDHEDLDDGITLLSHAIQITRTLSLELNPPILNNEGLDTALRWLTTHMKNNYKLNVDLQMHGPIDQIYGDAQMLLTNMIRELLSNVVIHSGTLIAHVNVSCEHKQIKVVVKDDGKGFDVKKLTDKASEKNKYGLFSVKERLGLFGGQFNIESQIGQGTICTIIYPYKNC